jgi:hypothetical protein
MTDETKHENTTGHGSYEHQDLQASGVLYFLLGLLVVTLLCIFVLRGLFAYLDHRAKASEPPVNPLVTNVPTDTLHVAPGYPQSAFPSPKLDEDERGQLNGIITDEEKELYSYGWLDEKAGTMHIPIERAIELTAQRGLPVRPQEATAMPTGQTGVTRKGEKK